MAKQPRSLSGKVAVITGGGRGIGKQTAHDLARKGVRVAIGDVDVPAAEAAAKEVGPGAIGLHLDVTDHAGFTRFLDQVEERLGPIDILINNAGIMPVVRFDEESDASIVRQLEINLYGVIHGTREAARRMTPRGTGHIVNIASVAGKTGFAGLATYCATKHAVVGYSESVRWELRDRGVDVSCVMPVIVRTELTSGLKEARGVKSITVEDVSREIVATLEFPRFDVFVPRSVGRLSAVLTPLPRRARDVMAKLMRTHDVILEGIDSPERRAYEQRAAASAPAAEEHAAEQEKAASV